VPPGLLLPLLPAPDEDSAAESLLAEPEAASFGFLGVGSEPWLGVEPIISKSVLWRFSPVVLVEGTGFGFAFSSWSEDASTEGLSTFEATVA
jgi:hypothetical protein